MAVSGMQTGELARHGRLQAGTRDGLHATYGAPGTATGLLVTNAIASGSMAMAMGRGARPRGSPASRRHLMPG
jgi:hypothetical protein